MSNLLRPEIETSYQAVLAKATQSQHGEYCRYFDKLEVSIPVVKGRKDVDVVWKQRIAVEKLDSFLEVRH